MVDGVSIFKTVRGHGGILVNCYHIPEAELEVDDGIDDEFEGLNLKKERVRLLRVLEAYYNKQDKMEYLKVGKNTQRWRGLQYDIEFAELRLSMIENRLRKKGELK